ncbi:alpha-tocopherol transfer protein-like [Aedes albopictus]|uniref:CRAL-TRIO domain-containing protein n=1 Tax=Aedes albopictus TaxID=7160 RepID=A0ABM1ZG49_AEDAL
MKVVNYASVEKLYKQFPDLRKQDVKEFGLWVQTQAHLPPVSELEMIQFIQSNEYDMEAAKRTAEAFYTFRSSYKDFFNDRDIFAAPIQRSMDVLSLVILPDLTPMGYHVLLAKIIDSDASKFNLATILKLAFMCVDVALWEEGCTEGFLLVIDMNGLHLGHFPKLGIFTLKNFLYYIQEALPIRLKGVHLINVVPFIDKIVAMIKPFMKKEILEIFHLHQKEDTVYPYIPQNILPSEYGGNAPSRLFLTKQLFDKTIELRDFILEKERSQKVDESKRIRTRSISNMFGLF